MKHKVLRMFVDFEKEEQWINEMSAKGLQFVSVSFPQYVFEEGEPGEYTYRLELMESHPRSGEGLVYIRFMEEAGVECVDTFWRWAYFRKKSADGAFDLYTDAGSKVKHYQRVATVSGLGAIVNAGLCAYDIWVLHMNPGMLVLNITIAIALSRLTWSFWSKIRKLKGEMKVRE